MATAEELEASHADIQYTCAGPSVLTAEHRLAGQEKRDALLKAFDVPALAAMMLGLDSVLHCVPASLTQRAKDADPDLALADVADGINRCLSARLGCGQDLKPIILGVGFDGEEHEAECPKCGNRFDWRSATSDEAAATKAERDAAALAAALG
jgi:hypothetical protein